jgi:hypothetical protein
MCDESEGVHKLLAGLKHHSINSVQTPNTKFRQNSLLVANIKHAEGRWKPTPHIYASTSYTQHTQNRL